MAKRGEERRVGARAVIDTGYRPELHANPVDAPPAACGQPLGTGEIRGRFEPAETIRTAARNPSQLAMLRRHDHELWLDVGYQSEI